MFIFFRVLNALSNDEVLAINLLECHFYLCKVGFVFFTGDIFATTCLFQCFCFLSCSLTKREYGCYFWSSSCWDNSLTAYK